MKYRVLILCAATALVASGCSLFVEQPGGVSVTDTGNAATKRCQDQGATVISKTASGGGKYDLCRFPDGTECEAWAYYHSLCKTGGDQKPETQDQKPETPRTETPAAPVPPAPAADAPASMGPIVITAPASGAQLASPVEIAGTAQMPDGKITVAFTNTAGKIIFSVPISVRNGTFKGKVGYEFGSTKEGYIEVFADSREGGAKVPVKF